MVMEVTEVRIKLVGGREEKLKAFATVTLNGCFVVRDLKVIQGPRGLFVAMPSRKLTARCPDCGRKNHLKAVHCNHCGRRLPELVAPRRPDADRPKLHADIAHPISQECRETLQRAVVAEYQHECERARESGYRPRPLDELDDAGPEELEE